ncbi:hypothetical protein [Marivita hallyeonensis]|uniref:Uncharacterized protein n=1 Tax=Marivita hallyeonensis TaxID=996342 RepID=A0A1M5RZC0_9RHOB|nr:hypothetical protein [Marivita hallyeonensis]SHH31702.1 hypothetical protein SAMN05443551_1953 [Marivita hallyeonensis]
MTIRVITPSVRSRRNKLRDQLQTAGLSMADAHQRVYDAYPVALELLDAGFEIIDEVRQAPRQDRVDAFMAEPLLVEFFGEATRVRHVNNVHRRLEGLRDRVERGFTVALKPDGKKTPLAQTTGALNTTRVRFRLYTRGIRLDIWDLAALINHEIGHQWFKDQKLGTEPVYGTQAARDLARYHPRRARKSTENYEQFCSAAHIAEGLQSNRDDLEVFLAA